VAAILGAMWLFAAAMFVTGLVMWRDWHALAREGVDHEAA
jgi:cytochrome b subunit of formate dehydrogenase